MQRKSGVKTYALRLVATVATVLLASAIGHAQDVAPAMSGTDGGKTDYILAVSWQPGFCETRPERKECVGQTQERFDATHFSLHGLWPLKKSYCGVDAAVRATDRTGDWLALPAVAMSDETAARLKVAMPGVRSGLDRHQWLRSGTCQTGTPQDYFALQLGFLDVLNASDIRRLFVEKAGGTVSEIEVKQAFDRSFGAGAGTRVRMRCAKDGAREVVTGLTIGLSGPLDAAMDLGRHILAAGPTDFKCKKGVADVAGLQ